MLVPTSHRNRWERKGHAAILTSRFDRLQSGQAWKATRCEMTRNKQYDVVSMQIGMHDLDSRGILPIYKITAELTDQS